MSKWVRTSIPDHGKMDPDAKTKFREMEAILWAKNMVKGFSCQGSLTLGFVRPWKRKYRVFPVPFPGFCTRGPQTIKIAV